MLALPDAARCRSMRAPPRADDMRARSSRALGLSEVQDGWEAPGGYAAPACAALSPSIAGRVKVGSEMPSMIRLARRSHNTAARLRWYSVAKQTSKVIF